MKLLLSIKPNYVKLILEGEKKYEYRKRVHKNKLVKTVIIYSSSPIQKAVAEFKIGNIICEKKAYLWDYTKYDAGITKQEFQKYFTSHKKGYAIEITDLKIYDIPFCIKERLNINYPPQSFMYLNS